MAYTDDAVLAKLSALNESHDSIATAAQWIMFHRRHADRTVQLWLQRLKDSPSPKRLNLIYLANEVTQQSKARHKDDFVVAFSPVIADATASAYRGAPTDVQGKLRRVIDVWKDRGIFEVPIQEAIEARIQELDKARGAPKSGFGASIFSSSSTPSELSSLTTPQQNVSKLILSTKAAINSANQDYEKVTDPAQPIPSAPVYAARLNGLLKTLATAEGAVAECVKARRELIGALEKILDTNKASLADEESQLSTLTSRKTAIDQKKQDVEFAIMRGLADRDQSPQEGQSASPVPEPDRPEVEALTPPSGHDDFYDDSGSAPPVEALTPPANVTQSPAPPQQATSQQTSATGIDILSNLALQQQQYQPGPSTNGANKRRRLDSGDDFPDLGNDDGIDSDVAEMLRRDSEGA